MGLLDGLLGGVVGGAVTSMLTRVIEEHGGIQGIAAQLQQKGLGEAVKSWISTGPNQPVNADQIHQALGPELISKLAAQFGLNPQDMAQKIAQFLPEVVDKASPNGKLPA